MILDVLARLCSSIAEDLKLEIVDFAIGIRYSYTVVRGPNGYAIGLCYVDYLDVVGAPLPCEPSFNRLEDMARSLNPLERILATALVNAVGQYLLWNEQKTRARIEKTNIVELLPKIIEKSRRVAVVGYMKPIVRALIDSGYSVVVLERSPFLRASSSAILDTYLSRVIKDVDVVLVTGSAITNDTLDTIVELAKARGIRIVLVGPSAGALPDHLFELGIDIVASIRITDVARATRAIRLGASRPDLEPYAQSYVAFPPS